MPDPDGLTEGEAAREGGDPDEIIVPVSGILIALWKWVRGK